MKISLNINVCTKLVFVKLIWSDLGIEKQHYELKMFTGLQMSITTKTDGLKFRTRTNT